MDLSAFFEAELDEHEAVLKSVRADLKPSFEALAECCAAALNGGHKIVLFGNGGSAADAQHIAAELLVRYNINRRPLAALALTTDSSTLTAGANDFGYDTVFERQVAGLCRAGDVAIGLTTSGNSENIVLALRTAKELGVTAAALAGKGGGRLNGLADPLLVVPSDVTARIQEMHITIGHMLCDVLERVCAVDTASS